MSPINRPGDTQYAITRLLTLSTPGNFSRFFCGQETKFQNFRFSKTSFRNTIRARNSFGSGSKQFTKVIISADDKSFQTPGRFKMTIQVIKCPNFIQNYKFLRMGSDVLKDLEKRFHFVQFNHIITKFTIKKSEFKSIHLSRDM